MPSDKARRAIALGAMALIVAAPAATAKTKEAPKDNWGEAFRQTMAAQIIDPNPQYDTAVPTTSGTTVAAAAERYRTDKVKRPDKISSSTVGRQAGSGSSSGN